MNAIMDIAWRDFVSWASENSYILAEYRATTGKEFGVPRSRIDAAIDEATGYGDAQARDFVFWVTRTHWGIEFAPESLKNEMAKACLAATPTDD